jgi:hypothetical protein
LIERKPGPWEVMLNWLAGRSGCSLVDMRIETIRVQRLFYDGLSRLKLRLSSGHHSLHEALPTHPATAAVRL